MHTIPATKRIARARPVSRVDLALGLDDFSPAPRPSLAPVRGLERGLLRSQWVAIFWAELRRLAPGVADAKAIRLAHACHAMASHIAPEIAAAGMAAGGAYPSRPTGLP
jgi:hypothetical protein